MKLNEETLFRRILELVGSKVELGVKSTGKVLKGKITNTMFDSFILEVQGKPVVLRFEDLTYLLPSTS